MKGVPHDTKQNDRPGAGTPERPKNEPTQKLNPIVPYLRGAVKTACVTLGVYIAAAVAALNLPALLVGVLALNALLGLWFALDGEVAT